MKKLLALTLSALLLASLAACGNTAAEPSSAAGVEPEAVETAAEEGAAEDEAPETITVKTMNGDREEIDLEVPYNPSRVAVMDLGALDIFDNLGLGDRIAGVSKGTSIGYLQSYMQNDALPNLGTIKEADLEAVMECEPELIIIGGRLSSYYDELAQIAPVIFLSTNTEIGLVESTTNNATMLAGIFGLEDKVADTLAVYNDRIEALREFAEGQTAVVGMVNAGGFGTLGNDGRCSIIDVEIGFENLTANSESEADSDRGEGGGRGGNSAEGGEGRGNGSGGEAAGGGTATHGNEASFEILVSLNPDYIFIMDRDAAIGTEGAALAAEVMDNEVVAMTDAYQNGNIVVLANSNVWYTAEGGITALGIMLEDLEGALLG